MKILVADKISPKGVSLLRSQSGFEVVESYNTPTSELLERVRDVHAIVVRSETRITAEVIRSAPQLRTVGRAGVGVDNIDVEAATERGIVVMNAPGGNTIATAELTFAHMLCSARPIPQATLSMRSGEWDRKAFSGVELHQKTLGILGLGRIGTEVARRAQAFGMTVIAYDPYLSPSRAQALQVEPVELDMLYSRADFLTVHLPLTETTRGLIGDEAFGRMRSGVRVFNCARGGIIDEAALLRALKSGKVAAAGLDVFEDEPLARESEFRGLANVSLTPHLGASTAEAQEGVGVEIAEAVRDVLLGGVVRNAVNMPSVDAATLKQLGPFLELGAKLGTLAQQLSPGRVSCLRITYFGSLVDLDANPVTRSVQRGFLRRISGEEVNFVNAPVLMQRLGVQVEATKSSEEADFTELIQVEAEGQERVTVAGTLLGKSLSARLVKIDGREVEASPTGYLLILENQDQPGIVGHLGGVMGRAGVNIAAMSLSRLEAGGTALTVVNLDSDPGPAAMAELCQHQAVRNARLVRL